MQKINIFSNHISGGIHIITPKLLCMAWMIQNKWAVLKYPTSIMSCALKNKNSSFQFSSVTQSGLTLCDPVETATHQASLSLTNSQSLLKLRSIELVMPFNHLILCRPLLFLPSIFPASGSFQMSQLFKSGGQRTGFSASTSVLPMNTQDWSPLGWTGWISLLPKGLSRVFSNTTVQKHQFFGAQLSL